MGPRAEANEPSGAGALSAHEGNRLGPGVLLGLAAITASLLVLLCGGLWWVRLQTDARLADSQEERHGRANVAVEMSCWDTSPRTADSHARHMEVMADQLRELYGSDGVRFVVLETLGDGGFTVVSGALSPEDEHWVRSHEGAPEWGSLRANHPLIGWREGRRGASGTRAVVDGKERLILVGWVIPPREDAR